MITAETILLIAPFFFLQAMEPGILGPPTLKVSFVYLKIDLRNCIFRIKLIFFFFFPARKKRNIASAFAAFPSPLPVLATLYLVFGKSFLQDIVVRSDSQSGTRGTGHNLACN